MTVRLTGWGLLAYAIALATQILFHQFILTPALACGASVMFGYAALIAFNTQRTAINRGFTLFTVLGDSGRVLASILLLVLPIFNFTSEAKWAIGITAICVDIFAAIQFLEWRKQR